MRPTLVLVLAAVAAALIAGCARSPKVRPDPYQQEMADLSTYPVVSVLVEGGSQVANAHGLDITLNELRREFIEHLKVHGKFEVREARAQEKAAQVRLIVSSLRYVSGASRGLVILAPAGQTRATLAVDMVVTDAQTWDVLWRLSAHQIERGVPTAEVTSVQIANIAKELAARLAAASRR